MKKILLLLLLISNYTFGQFSESFEGTAIPTGWTVIAGGDAGQTWALADLSSSTNLQAQNGTKVFAIMYGSTAHNDYLVTPQFTVVAGTSDKLTFWGRSRDPNYPETISVKASTTTATAAAMTTVLAASIAPASGANFVKYTIDLSALVGSSIYVGFHSTTTDKFYFDIDNVVVGGTPSCLESSEPLTFTNITTNSATVNWTAPATAPASGYDVYVSTSGVAPTALTSPTTSTAAGVTTASLTGLTPLTKYYVYVRSKCSTNSSSVWGHLGVFLTAPAPITPPYSYGFDNSTAGFTADGWAGGGTTATTWSTNFTAGNPHLGAGLIFSNNASTAAPTPVNRWMFSPGFQLQANSVNTITFYVRCLGAAPLPPQNFKMTVGNAATAAAQTTTVYSNTSLAVTAWTQITATFTPATTGVYHFAFNHVSPAPVGTVTQMSLALDTFAITSVLSNDEFKISKFAVYPNPASDVLTVQGSDNASLSSIQIVDLNGRQVFSNTYNNVTETKVNVSDLSAGMYLINITTDNKVITKKFLKQ